MKAVILAGGKGKRLRPYTEIIPKPLLPIKNKPVLEIILEDLKNQGIKEFFLATNYKSYLFKLLFGDGSKKGIKINYSKEKIESGTAGPLKNLETKLKKDFLLMNGDLIISLDINKLKKFHQKSLSDITIVTKEIETPIAYGVLEIKKNRVLSWKEKPTIKSEISTGIYLINPRVIKEIPPNKYYNMNQLVKKIIQKRGVVSRFLYSGKWIDIGLLEKYKEIQNEDFNMK